MSRDSDTSHAVEDTVIDKAQEMFLQNGYDKTTIRKISTASGVSSGSIYHFFSGKDGILKRIIRDFMNKSFEAADLNPATVESPYSRLALELCGQLRPIAAYKPIAELYLAAYKSWLVSDFIIRTGVKRNRELFQATLPDWTDEDYYRATTLIKGVLAVIVDERVHRDEFSQAQRARMLLEAVLPAFGAKAEDVETSLALTLNTLDLH